MDAATQKIVDEKSWPEMTDAEFAASVRSWPRVSEWDEPGLVDDVLAESLRRLEAAQRPSLDTEPRNLVDEARAEAERRWPGALDARYESDRQPLMERSAFRAGVEWAAAQRPPVSPEAREFVAELASRLYHVETHGVDQHVSPMPTAEVLREFDARFSVPSQPVYDEEKVAAWLADALLYPRPAPAADRLAAALVAALKNGELS